jgi:formate hydrogenlyase subunit 6/NADH:ubiquinone oxidoreductase subunit I
VTSMCTLCLRCVEMCPSEGCLSLRVADRTILQSGNWLQPQTTFGEPKSQ